MAGKPALTMVDLFAGCGGLSLGMENSGFTPVFVNELSPDAMATYLANRHHVLNGQRFDQLDHLHCRDAQQLKGSRLDKLVEDLRALDLEFPDVRKPELGRGSSLDLLAGGPPCQGYSGIGHRRSYSVDKQDIPSNQLYQRMAEVIKKLRPRIFLFENVEGLLRAKWTRDGARKIWPDVLSEFKAIPGYEVRYSLVSAGDYGVPQNRPRVLLVGIRKDIVAASTIVNAESGTIDAVESAFLPRREPSDAPDIEDLLSDLVDPEVGRALDARKFDKGKLVTTAYPRPPQNEIQRKLRTPPRHAGGRVVELTEQEYSRHRRDIIEKFEHMLKNDGAIPDWGVTKKFAQRVLPPSWGNKRPSITVTSLQDDFVHYCQPRTPTVREWARLQTFPDWYQFMGKRTTGGVRRAGNPREGNFEREVPKYTQIGNAVPVELAERVGNHFRKILDDASKNAQPE